MKIKRISKGFHDNLHYRLQNELWIKERVRNQYKRIPHTIFPFSVWKIYG